MLIIPMSKKITEHKIRALKGKSSRFRITGDNLQIEVNPSGKRVWFCQGRANGSRFRKKLGEYPAMSVKDAREAVRKVLHERDEGVRIIDDPQSFEVFVEGAFRDWCEGTRKQGVATMKRIRFTHVPVLGHKKLRDITQRDIEQHKTKLLKTKANATVKRELGDLKRIFSKAVEWGLLRQSPAANVPDPKVETSEKLYLTDDEMGRLQDALAEWEQKADAEWHEKGLPEGKRGELRYHFNPDLRKFIRVLVNTGLRKNEALSLQWRDIDLGNGTPSLIVRPEVVKSGRRRTIPINQKLIDVLLPSMGLTGDELKEYNRKVLKSRGETRIFSLQYPSKAWQKLRRMADLEHVTLHHLRHNFASQLVLRGVAPNVIQRLLGHTSLEVTMLYFSVRKEDEIEAVNLL